MPHAFSLPRISTNVRFAASHLLFPELAGAWAERLFLTPPRGRDAAASALDLIDSRIQPAIDPIRSARPARVGPVTKPRGKLNT
jgi:hypothetical protein